MALRIWLPLNGNLNNQGLSDLTFSNTNTTNLTIDAGGKIGSCYQRATKQTAGYITSNKTILLDNNITMCCWALVSDGIASANGLITNHNHSTNTGVGLTFKYISSIDFRISCNTGTGSGRTYDTYYGTTNIKDAWHHLALTYDNTTHQLLLYVDGVVEYTLNNYTNASQEDWIRLFEWSTNYDNTNYRPAVKLNDVRIYDECLSQKQIKEISKGLVAHYKLDNKYLEATTNLTSLSTFTSGCYNGATNKYGYGENTDIYKEIGVFQGKKCLKIYMGTSGLSARPYPYISNLFVSDGTNQPAYKTLSFDYYGTVGNYLNPYKLGSGSGTCTWTNDKTTTKTGSFTNSGNIPVVLNQWQHITMTLHGTTEANSEWGYVIIGDTHTSNVNNYWLFANVQLETKDHETGYTEGSRAAQTYEADCSGNGHVATPIGTCSYSLGTPRYSGSTLFTSSNIGTSTITGASFLTGEVGLTTPNALTISFWGKVISYNYQNSGIIGLTQNTYPSDLSNDTINQYDGGFRINSNSGNYCSLSALNLIVLNEWHLYTISFDGTTAKSYRDGVLIESKSLTGPLKTFSRAILGLSQAGGSYRKTTAYWNDFRIYTTALSADDIKELYQTSAWVDNRQNIMTYEFKEV